VLLVVRKKEKYNRLICRQLDRLLVSRRFIVSSGLRRSRRMLCRYCNFAVKYPFIYLLPTLVHLRRRQYAQRSQRHSGCERSLELELAANQSGVCRSGSKDLQRIYTVSQKKTVQISFCQNFVKFPQILVIFDRKMAKRLKLYEEHSISTSRNSRHHTTALNADVPNCYTTLKVVIFNKLSSDLISTQ